MKLLGQMPVLSVVALVGCTFYARGPNDYRQAVRSVLEARNAQLEGCYRSTREQHPESQGAVVVRFDVEPKTGEIVRPEIVQGETTAGEPLQRCVMESLSGLKLEPPDQRLGQAKFRWDFQG